MIAGIGWSYMAAGKIAAAAPEKKGKTTGSKK